MGFLFLGRTCSFGSGIIWVLFPVSPLPHLDIDQWKHTMFISVILLCSLPSCQNHTMVGIINRGYLFSIYWHLYMTYRYCRWYNYIYVSHSNDPAELVKAWSWVVMLITVPRYSHVHMYCLTIHVHKVLKFT